jgi:hypothetical protein
MESALAELLFRDYSGVGRRGYKRPNYVNSCIRSICNCRHGIRYHAGCRAGSGFLTESVSKLDSARRAGFATELGIKAHGNTADEETPALIAKGIKKIAEEISGRSLLGLVHNWPEPWAHPAGCFANVICKVAKAGVGMRPMVLW